MNEIQRLAYQLEDKRCPRDVWKMHLKALQFAVNFKDLFNEPVNTSLRKMFGAPFHSLITHLPEQFRLGSTRSIIAEGAGRMFHTLK